MKTTKKEALHYFIHNIMPIIKKNERNRVDKPYRRLSWNSYTDNLHRDGMITDNQVNNWTNPF